MEVLVHSENPITVIVLCCAGWVAQQKRRNLKWIFLITEKKWRDFRPKSDKGTHRWMNIKKHTHCHYVGVTTKYVAGWTKI